MAEGIIKEGYLQKKSIHLKILRKRWMVLKENHLYCYKSKHIYKNPTETFDLTIFNDIKVSPNNGNNNVEFELISSKQTRIFIASTITDRNQWISSIKNAIYTAASGIIMSLNKPCFYKLNSNNVTSFTFDSTENPINSRVARDYYRNPIPNPNRLSFHLIIISTIHHLVFGYISRYSPHKIIPYEVEQICFNYFIGDCPLKIDDDELSGFNDKGRKEIFQIIFDILCPDTNSKQSLSSLITLIELIFYAKNKNKIKEDSYIYSIYDKRPSKNHYYETNYLSLLLSLTKIIHIYDTLKEIAITQKIMDGICIDEDEVSDYNALIVYLCDDTSNSAHCYWMQLLYELINENCNYYTLCKQLMIKLIPEAMCRFLREISVECININTVRAMATISCGWYLSSNNCSSTEMLRCFTEKMCKFEELTNEINIELYYLWMWIEIKVLLLNSNNNINENVLKQLKGFMSQILAIQETKNLTVMSITMEICYTLIVNGMNIFGDIINFEGYLEFINYSLRLNISQQRMDKYSLVGWVLLSVEIEKIESQKNDYMFYNDWNEYIESKIGLFQMSIVECIHVLKGKCDGNLKDAQLTLNTATKLCWKLNKLIENNSIDPNKMVQFNKLYNKITKTKVIKPIIHKLENFGSSL